MLPILAAEAAVDAVATIGKRIVNHFFPDPKDAVEAEAKLRELDLKEIAIEAGLLQGQMDINKEEAKSVNWFVAGWRPFVGWICGVGLGYVAIIEPLARFIAKVAFNYQGTFPAIDTTLTMQVLLGMLGLATVRTVEKVKGSEANR